MSEFIDLLLPWREATDDQISDVFVYIIGTAFLIFGFYFFVRTFIQRRLICGLIKDILKYDSPAQPRHLHELKEIFSNKERTIATEKFSGKVKLTEAWQEFEDSLITRERGENQSVAYKTDEASLFFSEDRLLEQHLNLRFWNSVPALLVGFGILGTFVGLVRGLIPFSGINFTQTEEIRSAIQILLSGVSTAFVTSVWGMLTSLVFNGMEKWRIGRVSQAIANLQRALDQLFTLTTQEQISYRQEDELEQQTAALKSVATDFATAIDYKLGQRFDALRAAIAEIKGAMEREQEKIIQKLDNAPTAIGEQLEPNFSKLETAIGSIKDEMLRGKTDIIQKLDETSEALSNAIGDKLESNFKKLGTAVEGIKSEMTQGQTEIIHELQNAPEAFSNAVREQLEPSLEKLNNAVEKLREEKEASSIDAINELVEEFKTSLSGTAMEQIEKLAETVGDISENLKDLPNQITQIITSVQEQIDRTRELLGEKSKEQREEIEKSFMDMLKALEEANKGATDAQAKTTESVNRQMEKRLEEMGSIFDQSKETLRTTIIQLKEALDSSTSKASTESSEMIKQMREQVNLAAERLDTIFKSGEEHVNHLLQLQADQIKGINEQLANSQETLTRGGEMLKQMDSSIENVRELIDTTKDFSGLLTTGANQLQVAGQNLTRASEEFNRENRRYLEANSTTIARIEDALERSNQTLNDFAQRFQTIDKGLQGIFAEIERGLTSYSKITGETIKGYIGTFPAHLENAATALARSIQAMREEVDLLNDMIERLLARLR